MKKSFLVYLLFTAHFYSIAQNVGIGTNTPAAKLHVNGDLKLLNGDAVNKFSRDSLFAENSHNNIPTEKAIKDYMQKGTWINGASQTIGSQAPLARGISPNILTHPVAVQAGNNNIVYVACFDGSFQIYSYNVSNPDSIYWVGRKSTAGNQTKDMFVINNTAITITQNTNNLFVFDISNPANIISQGSLSLGGERPVSVFAKGNIIYVATENPAGTIRIFDFSNPNAIISRGTLNLGTNTPTDLFIKDNYAYVTTFGSTDKLSIYDISNPDVIVAKGSISVASMSPSSVSINNNYAFVTSQGFNRVNIYNVINPDVITAVGNFNTEINNPSAISIANNIAFVTNTGNSSVSIFDISNPASVKFKGSSQTNLSNPWHVFASGNFGYVASYNNNRLCVFDLDMNGSVSITPAGMQIMPTQWQVGTFNTIYRSNGYIGIGTSAPQQRLHLIGNQAIEGLLGIGTSSPQASLHVEGNTALNGNTGIGNLYPNAPLQFAAATANRKIVLYEVANNEHQFYGLGVNSGILRYQVYSNIDNHVFYSGASSGSSTELMRIKGNGNVGIGNNNPTRPLSFPASLGEKILLYPGGVGEVGIGVYGNELRLHADNPGAKVSFGTQDNAGNFTEAARAQISGGYGFYINGSLWANGTTYASDERFKQNITPIALPLQKLMQLNGVEYEMRTKEFAKNNFQQGRQMGLLAQNIEKVVPEAVNELDGYKGVDYARLVPLLIESIKDQQKQIEELKFLLNKFIGK